MLPHQEEEEEEEEEERLGGGGREREIYLQSRLLKRTVLVARAQTHLQVGGTIKYSLLAKYSLLVLSLCLVARAQTHLQVQLEITLPDALGRGDIMAIHLRGLREQGRLADGCYEWACEAVRSQKRKGWSGAEIAGVVRAAAARAVQRAIDASEEGRTQEAEVLVTRNDVAAALEEVAAGRPASVRKARSFRRKVAGLLQRR